MAENLNVDVSTHRNGMYPMTSTVTGSEAINDRCSNFYENIRKIKVRVDGAKTVAYYSTVSRQLADDPKRHSVFGDDVTENDKHYHVPFYNGDDSKRYTQLNVQTNNNSRYRRRSDRCYGNNNNANSFLSKGDKKSYAKVFAVVGSISVVIGLAAVIGYIVSNPATVRYR